MLCMIWGFYGGYYKEWRFLGCDTVWLLFRTDVSEEDLTSIIRLERIWLVNFVPSSLILSTFMMGAIHSSETLVLTKATRPKISKDGILLRMDHPLCRLQCINFANFVTRKERLDNVSRLWYKGHRLICRYNSIMCDITWLQYLWVIMEAGTRIQYSRLELAYILQYRFISIFNLCVALKTKTVTYTFQCFPPFRHGRVEVFPTRFATFGSKCLSKRQVMASH
jgi:hypothetical protein